ncbi:MAG: hypothetical protein ACOYOP_11715 [Microthrixaceae bacterium]
MTIDRHRHRTAAAAAALVTALVLWAAPSTAGADTSAYAAWTPVGANGTTGTMAVGIPGFPAAPYASTATSVAIQTSAVLSASTPFGAVFGTSAGQQYANIRAATGQTPSSTTFTFDTPTPASGWGFTVGDVDADAVTITAIDANGVPVPVSGLGFESTFNYAGQADTPVWDPATATLTGNGADTSGASAWFRPTVAIRSITFTFSVQTGIPIYQLWFAALGSSIPTTTTTTTTTSTTTTTTTTLPATTTTTVPASASPDSVGTAATPSGATAGSGASSPSVTAAAIRFTG